MTFFEKEFPLLCCHLDEALHSGKYTFRATCRALRGFTIQVFTTVGSASKRKFLLETFPGLRDDHIGDSRSESFEGLVRNMTRGKGVHLCLNSLSDEKLQVDHPHPDERLLRMLLVVLSLPSFSSHDCVILLTFSCTPRGLDAKSLFTAGQCEMLGQLG